MRGMIRDMMRYHSNRFNTPQLRIQQSRALLDFLAQSGAGRQQQRLQRAAEAGTGNAAAPGGPLPLPRALEEVNEPTYFHQFMARAMNHNLKYLGESRSARW